MRAWLQFVAEVSTMQCPKCSSPMSLVPVASGAQVERCDGCQGIACSDSALTALERQWFLWPATDPSDLDPGSARVGRRWDRVRSVPCPACGRTMLCTEVAEQEHIRLDRCRPCGLTFFDAGEMTDLRFRTLLDVLRRLLRRRD
jgi:Zn-finger nucleic acid-binding protein